MSDVLLTIRDLRVWFPINRGVFSRTIGHVKAVDGVSLDLYAGETLGLVGESGCGKTTLGRAIVGLDPITEGSIQFQGSDLRDLRGAEWKEQRQNLQMIFQDPFASLNPRMTVLDIVTEGLREHHPKQLREEGAEVAAKRLLREVGLGGESVHRYPHEFSGGQRQRISVARAISLHPEFVICDEAVSALDVSVQAQVINLLRDLSRKYQLAYLFITHDLSVVRHISDRIAVMYLGKIVELGSKEAVIEDPKHPYTKALISAVPIPGRRKSERIVLSGDVPSPAAPPSGCPFHTRCPHVMEVCRKEIPEVYKVDGSHVSCHLYKDQEEIKQDLDEAVAE